MVLAGLCSKLFHVPWSRIQSLRRGLHSLTFSEVLLTGKEIQLINLRISYGKPILGTCSDPIAKEPPWARGSVNPTFAYN